MLLEEEWVDLQHRFLGRLEDRYQKKPTILFKT
jgi:hypothetical protein